MTRRYARQISLPEIGPLGQEKLQNTCIVMIGAGGLGAPALPYLAAAGIGNITIIDHDNVDETNLHRQTIYRMEQIGQNKARCAADYLRALNPEITIKAITSKLTQDNAGEIFSAHNSTLILDGSDNFETKALLNDISIATQTPLISASVNQWLGQIGIFEGYRADQGCYRCIFPEFPSDARNCNDAGILGTAAGLIGMMQAHLALGFLLDLDDVKSGQFYTVDLKTIRTELIMSPKNPDCPYCTKTKPATTPTQKNHPMPELIPIKNLNDHPTIIIDVRQPEELTTDPLIHPLITKKPLNIPLPELVARLDELPQNKRLAFICAGNVRSRQAANYLAAHGHNDVCILDKFSL